MAAIFAALAIAAPFIILIHPSGSWIYTTGVSLIFFTP